MTIPLNLYVGQLVEFSGKDSGLRIGAILSLSGKGVRVLLTNGKETTIAEKNVLHATAGQRVPVNDLDACRAAIQAADERRKVILADIDLEQAHALLVEEQPHASLAEIAALYVDDGQDDGYAAVLRALENDALYFRKRKDDYCPVSNEEVARAKQQIARQQAQEQETTALIAALNQSQQHGHPIGPVTELVDLLLDSLCNDNQLSSPKHLAGALARAGLGTSRKLFQFLVSIGVIDQHESLLMLRNKISRQYPVALSAAIAATVEATGQLDPARRDLGHLTCWALDAEDSKDRDDAFSVEYTEHNDTIVWVHIADPAAFIAPESALDLEARRRATTLYLPDGNVPMLPQELGEDAFSLLSGAKRAALSLRFRVSPGMPPTDVEILPSYIRVTHAIGCEQADRMLPTNIDLQTAVRVAKELKQRRQAMEASILPQQPELAVKYCRDSDTSSLVYRHEDGPCQDMVAELMVWANHLFACWCRDRQIPVLFRTQAPPDEELPPGGSSAGSSDGPSDGPSAGSFDPVAFFRGLRMMKKTTVGLVPGKHAALGFDPYIQATAPLRRYADLLMLRQIGAALRGDNPPYSAELLTATMLLADEGYRLADEIMADRNLYFLLCCLKEKERVGQAFSPGVVVDNTPPEPIFYVADLCAFRHCRRPSFALAPGMPVRVKFRQIDPFERILRYELLPAT